MRTLMACTHAVARHCLDNFTYGDQQLYTFVLRLSDLLAKGLCYPSFVLISVHVDVDYSGVLAYHKVAVV